MTFFDFHFLKNFLKINYMYACVSVCVSVCGIAGACGGIRSPGGGVKGRFEPLSDMGSGD